MHSHEPDNTSGQSQRRMLATLGVTGTIMLAELVGGFMSESLSLLADAGHMLTDLLALGVAYAALRLGALPADNKRTYGYRRLEVLAALLNGLALVVVSGSIVWEAAARWLHPVPVHVPTMLAVASVGLVANLVGLWLLGHGHSLNMRAAFLHILGDTLSSVGVIVGGGIIWLTGWTRIDALLSVGIAVIIIVTSFNLLREVIDVLLEAVPKGIRIEDVQRTIHAVTGVQAVHDLHIWSITAGMPALSAHVVLRDPNTDAHAVLCAIQTELRTHHAISHATLQIERENMGDCGCV